MSTSQVAAACRHVVTFVAGGATVMAALHVISADEASHLGTAVSDFIVALAPVTATLSAAYATWKSSHVQQIKSVNAIDGVKVVNENAPGLVVTAPPKK